MSDEYLGLVTFDRGEKYVWVVMDDHDNVTAIQAGDGEHIDGASDVMDRDKCERAYPGLWASAVIKVRTEWEHAHGV
jgi:hypothetical protein